MKQRNSNAVLVIRLSLGLDGRCVLQLCRLRSILA